MSRFDTYRDSFPNARLARSKTGVLEVALHIPTNSLSTCFMRSGLTVIIALSS